MVAGRFPAARQPRLYVRTLFLKAYSGSPAGREVADRATRRAKQFRHDRPGERGRDEPGLELRGWHQHTAGAKRVVQPRVGARVGGARRVVVGDRGSGEERVSIEPARFTTTAARRAPGRLFERRLHLGAGRLQLSVGGGLAISSRRVASPAAVAMGLPERCRPGRRGRRPRPAASARASAVGGPAAVPTQDLAQAGQVGGDADALLGPPSPSRKPVMTSSNNRTAPWAAVRAAQGAKERGAAHHHAHVPRDRLHDDDGDAVPTRGQSASSDPGSLYGSTTVRSVNASGTPGDPGTIRWRRRCRHRPGGGRRGRGSRRRTSPPGPSRWRPGHPDRRHRRLGAGVDQPHHLDAGHTLHDQLRQLGFGSRWGGAKAEARLAWRCSAYHGRVRRPRIIGP